MLSLVLQGMCMFIALTCFALIAGKNNQLNYFVTTLGKCAKKVVKNITTKEDKVT
jgi:hypothetical protein